MLPTGPLLFIDAAWPHPAAGVWEAGAWRAFARADKPPAESLFGLVETVLHEAGTPLPALAGYIYAEGPGSVLGLRSAAMALRAWNRAPGLAARPVFAVNSLALALALAMHAHPDARPLTVFAASRRDRWNALSPGDAHWAECDAAALAGRPGPFLRLPARDFAKAPVDASDFDPVDALGRCPGILNTPELLRVTDAPDAANLANAYATWTGERHRA